MYQINVFYPDGKTCHLEDVKTMKELRKSIRQWFMKFVTDNYSKEVFERDFFCSFIESVSDEKCVFSHILFRKSDYKQVFQVYCEF